MKYLKLFENFNEDYIHSICKKYEIENYTINPDGSIDVNGNVNLSTMNLTKLPLKFRNVSGTFNCRNNQLITLKGSPQSVDGDFNCLYNKLKSLKGGPKSVGGVFDCNNNQLITLKGSPQSVGEDFYCSNNKLKSFEGAPQSIGGDFYCSNNELKSFEGLKSIRGEFICYNNPIDYLWYIISPNDRWDEERMELFNELDIIQGDVIILDRLNYFLNQIGIDPVDSVEGYEIED